MANPFPPATPYNGQYSQPPFYPPYMQNTGSTNPGHPTPLPPFPPLSANAQRFEANSHVPSPPLPGQLPLNPELLRHLAASGRFPFPPPPPPPPPQLFSNSFPPNQQATNSPAPPGPHQYPPFQRPRSQFETATPPLTQTAKVNLDNNRENGTSSERNRVQKSGYSQSSVNGSNVPTTAIAHSLDGTSFSRMGGAISDTAQAQSDARDALPAKAVTEPDKAPLRALSEELHLKAKVAIKECLPIGADYNFWLQSGINSSVLDNLFDELNIDRRAPVLQEVGKPVDMTQETYSPAQANNSLEVKEDPVPLSQTPQPEGLDRKDRIARLLAAKKGQALTSAKSSQSGSPAPERVIKDDAASGKLIESQVQAAPKLDVRPDTGSAKATQESVQPIETAAMSPLSVSTPMKAQSQQSTFAIPGLFMTSADEILLDGKQLADKGFSEPTSKPNNDQIPAPKSLKRRAEALSDEVLPQQKRQASHVLAKPVKPDRSMDIVPTPDQTKLTEQTPAPPKEFSNDQDRVQDISGATPNRSKVNQSVLKDRMAALKAQIQMNKARKETLQDGMPVLAAEVEKTRQNLDDRHSRLIAIRKDIELKNAEIVNLRAEETEVLQEIKRLDSQLLDGENGQRQFSNELNQLDSQIQVNETESAESQRSTAIVSPSSHDLPTATTSRPVSAGKLLNTSIIANEQAMIPSEPIRNEVNLMTEQSEDPRRSLTTEYNPEQADLDRQLESDSIPAMQDEIVDVSETSIEDNDPAGSTNDTPELEASIGHSTMDDQISEADSDDDRMSIDEASDAGSSGSASMSDSGSEDYEPALNQDDVQPEIEYENDNENDDYEPAEPYQMPVDAENDDYEPAEQVAIIDVNKLEETQENHDIPPAEPAPMIDTSIPATNGALVEDVTPLSSSPTMPTSTSQTSPIVTSMDQKLTIPQQPAIVDSFPVLAPLSDGEKPVSSRFVPYQSPLANFKSFRFHPQFTDVVKNGFRSLTYSNNIDPKNPICSNELEGRFCDDVNCADQHFGSMALSDDKILVQMSSANDLKDKDQRDAYLLGLKKVIAGLREQGVREFSEVANALSKYRREWLQGQDGIVT